MEPFDVVVAPAPRLGEREIDVHASGVVGDRSIVGLLRIEVLNEVVFHGPFPNDLAVSGSRWPDFDDARRPEGGASDQIGVGAERYRLLVRNEGVREDHYVAVRHFEKVVVLMMAEVPNDVPLGVEHPIVVRQQVPVVEQFHQDGAGLHRPSVNGAPFVVDQVDDA